MKPPVISYTFLNTWDICPHQAARKYIIKDLPREAQTTEMVWGNEVHEAMEKRLKYKTPLPEKMVAYETWCAGLDKCVVEPEQKLGMTAVGRPCGFWDDDVYLRGKLDAPVLLRTDAVALLDWKTGKRREDPFELAIGALLLKAHKPEVNVVIGSYVWLKDGVKGPAHDVSDTERTWTVVQNTMDDVGHQIKMGVFAKKQGPLCGYCPVTDCQHNRRKK